MTGLHVFCLCYIGLRFLIVCCEFDFFQFHLCMFSMESEHKPLFICSSGFILVGLYQVWNGKIIGIFCLRTGIVVFAGCNAQWLKHCLLCIVSI